MNEKSQSVKGSSNLQKILKLKDKMRIKNLQYLKRIKEVSPLLSEKEIKSKVHE